MAGKQAKVLSESNVRDLLAYASVTRHPKRNIAIVLLSVKAGLRAAEIAKLTWEMLLDANGRHSLRDVESILDAHYLGRDAELAEIAVMKLETRTKL